MNNVDKKVIKELESRIKPETSVEELGNIVELSNAIRKEPKINFTSNKRIEPRNGRRK